MAWAGEVKYQLFKDYFIIEFTGFDADTEASTKISLDEFCSFLPSHYTLNVRRTDGATDAVDVDLELYTPDDNYFEVHGTLTNSAQYHANSVASTTVDYTSATAKPSVGNYTQLRVIVNTVGAANTLAVTLVGRR